MDKEIKTQCEDCDGTGLYRGIAEKDECAVVCSRCDGTGCRTIKYTLFTERKKRTDIKRVFKSSCGFCHSSKDTVTKDGQKIEFSKGGASYEEWLQGKDLKPIKELYCPYYWESQSLQQSNHPQHGLYEKRCEDGIRIGSYISACTHFKDMVECWKIYEDLEKIWVPS